MVFNASNTKKGIIFAHGMTVNKVDEGVFVRADQILNELGFSTIRFDFRGHGESDGDSIKDFTISNELIDLESIYSFLKSEGAERIGLAGASFGGGIAALFSTKHPDINKLLLVNPVLDYKKCFLNPTTLWAKEHFFNVFERIDKDGYISIGSRKFKVGRELFEEMYEFRPCEALQDYKNPPFVVHGDNDSKVAVEDVKDCFSGLKNPYKKLEIVKGSEHGFHEEPYQSIVTDMIVEFFSE